MIALAFQPVANSQVENSVETLEIPPPEVPSAFRDLSRFVTELMTNTDDTNHSDDDGLPDSVELVIGTDPNNPDSDFDQLNDYEEAFMGLNPNKADSNDDRFSDYVEVTNVSLDVDEDGLPNAWDSDNDDDGVPDYLDFSPFAKTVLGSSFEMSLNTSGGSTYISFQLRTKNPDHMRLIQQSFDWPRDGAGSFMDLDGSVDDVMIIPLLRIDSQNLPAEEEVADYGIVVDGSSAYVPLFPVWDYGNMVALKGRMFLPAASAPVGLDMEASLVWRVSGLSDNEIKAFMVDDAYLSLQSNGTITASGATVGTNETFVWIQLGGNRAALKASNGMYVALDPSGSISALSSSVGPETEFTFNSTEGGHVKIVASNGNELTALADGWLSATASEGGGNSTFTEEDLGVAPSPRVLATYNEDFTLTGVSVNENFGSSVGVFSGADTENLTAANLLLAYDFLRDPTCGLNDTLDRLADHDLDEIVADIDWFPHQDAALVAATSTMIPDAVHSIPAGETLPVIVGMEDAFASLELADVSTDYQISGPLSFDLTSEPVVVTKMLRSSWYVGGDDTPLELYQVIDEVRSWGLGESALQTAVGLASAWYCGEQTIASVGGVSVDYDCPEVVFVDETVDGIINGITNAIDLLMNTIEILDSAYAFSETFAKLATLTKSASQTTWSLFKSTFNSVKEGLLSGTKLMQRISTAMNIVAVVIAVVMSFYALFSIGEELGWGAVGTGIAVTYAIVMLAYALALTALSVFGGPVGAVIAAIIAIVDLLAQLLFGFDFMGEFIGWLIDCFTDVRTRSEVNMDLVGSDLELFDVDGNGIDAGDNITYASRLYGNVTITGDGSYTDLVESYITPHQVLTAPWGSSSITGGRTVENSTVYTSSSKSVLYETEAWLRPGMGMVNFPVAVGLYTDYKIFYDDCWWFFGWWCDRESQVNDPANTQVSQWTTIYFDVMPGSIEEFYNWRGMVSSDADGDGLNNSEEAAASTDPWLLDTDADGLGDSYELQIGTDPRSPDTDSDGLNDRFEHSHGYNPMSKDSDGDRLKDYFEYRGWAVNITYRGHPYYWLVNSEPNMGDTDGDNVTDYEEYFSYLNPRSPDTDGDGTLDLPINYYVTKMEVDTTYDVSSIVTTAWPMAVDEDGIVYAGEYDPTFRVVMINPDGTLAGSFLTDPCEPYEMDVVSITVGSERETLVLLRISGTIEIYSTDGTQLGEVYIGDIESPGDNPFECMAVEPEGPEPGTYYLYAGCRLSHVHKLLMNESGMVSVVATWGGYGSDPGQLQLAYQSSIDVDQAGDIYVYGDLNNRMSKFKPDGTFVTMWGEHGVQDGQFDNMRSIAVDADGNLLTFDAGGDYADRIQKFAPDGRWLFTCDGEVYGTWMDVDPWDRVYISSWEGLCRLNHTYEPLNPEPPPVFEDADGDFVSDVAEVAGYNITVAFKHGSEVLHVTSDPMAPDTDFDGLNDENESALMSDPRAIDSDKDKLTDLEELELGTNLTSWDSDGDGLGDGQEVKFGSDPNDRDTDGEGLSDYQEFVIGTDPSNRDTDDDSLDDMKEVAFGSDPKNPDEDGDFMFDGQEFELGADPDSKDTDSDGIDDGYEMLYETNATSGDSDGDQISDGFEVSSLMSPLSNDTDGDGVNDSRELSLGLNPKSRDSDGDGIPDSLDKDYEITLDGEIVLVYDDADACAAFAHELASNASVRTVNVSTLLSGYSNARYIVLVGDPDAADGTAGGLIHELLLDSGDVLERMRTSEYERMAVRYGLWADTQTVVMLSHVYDTDAIRVIGVLKSMKMTVSDRSVLVDYLNPRACFLLYQIDTMRVTDTFVWAWIGSMTTFSVEVEKLNDTQVQTSLSGSDALDPNEVIMGKYVRIGFQSDDPKVTSVLGALVKIYYTSSDLDLNGDGNSSGPEDMNETWLELFVMSPSGEWVRLSDAVDTTGVNTTDVELFGTLYDGYLWANVSGFSLFGIAGYTNEGAPTPDDLYNELRYEIRSLLGVSKLNMGRVNSLLQKTDSSQSRYQAGGIVPATNILEALIQEVHSMVKTKALTQEQGDLLVEKANGIIAAIHQL